jgi:DnaJ-class molecular chaperone
MPIYEEKVFDVERYGKEPAKGNLIVTFVVEIPKEIDIEKKERVIEILSDCFEREEN